jgi:hypothetical protein
MKYGQSTADQAFGDAYNRFNADKDRRFNRLSSLAGTGQTATNQVQTANSNYGNQVSATQRGIGNAEAAYHTGMGDMYRQYGQQAMSAFTMSDRREKTSIQSFNEREFLEPLKAYTYEYSNKENGEGRHVGVMAQDLKHSKVGREFLVEEDERLLVDYFKMVPALLATIVKLNERIAKLEEAA